MMDTLICTQTLEMKIEALILKQCNKLLIDYKKPPANMLSDADDRYGDSTFKDSMFKRVFEEEGTDVYPTGDDYPLSDTELADISDYRLIEVIRKEQITVFNLDEQMTLDIPEFSVPLLYVCPALGMQPIEYPVLQQNCQAYLYPVNLRLVLNREQTAFPEVTTTATESLIREGLKYVLDRSVFLQMDAVRSGYNINSRVIDHVGFVRSTLEGFLSPWEVFDYEMGFVIREQATRAANPYN